MDYQALTYVPSTSDILVNVCGTTYECPTCTYLNVIDSKESVFGTLLVRTPDKKKVDLLFGHTCTHCGEDCTINHYLPHNFRVWLRSEDEESSKG